MSTPRDPRVDPKAGDQISRNDRFRTVVKVDRFDIYYNARTLGMGSFKGVDRKCFITTWQDWARKAEVKVTAV